jgi:hypothetical protein
MVKRVAFVLIVAGALAAGFGSACFPGLLDLTGKRCDTSRPCGDGYVCFDERCYRVGEVDAGPDNWLLNGDFEEWLGDGGGVGWSVKPGRLARETADVHQGMSAVRIWAHRLPDGGLSGNPVLVPLPAVDGPRTGQTWCAIGWVRTISADGGALKVSLNIREALDGDPPCSIITQPVGPRWAPIDKTCTLTDDGVSLDVRISFAPTNAIDTLFVDDVRLWRSATNTCE